MTRVYPAHISVTTQCSPGTINDVRVDSSSVLEIRIALRYTHFMVKTCALVSANDGLANTAIAVLEL
jgi:hypothetical protein